MNKRLKVAIAGAVAAMTIGCGTLAANASSPATAVRWNGTTHMLPKSVKVNGLVLLGAITYATPGYWDIQVNATAAGKAVPQLFLFDGDTSLFNIGEGELPPTGQGYLNGSMTVFIARPAEKVYVYAGGYGTYTLKAVNVTSTEF